MLEEVAADLVTDASTSEPATRGRRWIGRSANAALGAAAYFTVAVALLHVLRPEYDPRVRFLSEYAVGRYGALMTSSFFALAVTYAAIAYGLSRSISPSPPVRGGVIGLYVCAAGVMMAGLFVTDLRAEPKTTVGIAHDAGSLLAFLGTPVSAILLAFGVRRDRVWRRHLRVFIGLGIGVVAGLGVFIASFATGTVGVHQRVYVGFIVLWLTSVAVWLRRSTDPGWLERAPRREPTPPAS